MQPYISTIEEIIGDIKAGKMVILTDEEDRENEGDLVIAAEHITPEAINFMAKFGRGLICLTLTETMCSKLQLPMMVQNNASAYHTNFTVSIEAAEGVTTGISAADRAHTIKTAISPNAKPTDLVQPGHIFPIRAVEGGVLMRAGHTEAGCDLARLAQLTPAAVICEIMKDDGTMARMPDLIEFAKEHGLKIGTIADLIQYRSKQTKLIQLINQKEIDTEFGKWQGIIFQDTPSKQIHLALIKGDPTQVPAPLVRVHEPFTAFDLIETVGKSHSWPLPEAMRKIDQEGNGVIILLNCVNQADQLINQFQTSVQHTRSKPDIRTYGVGAQILIHLGIQRMKVLTSPRKMPSMIGYGLEIIDYILYQDTKQPPTI